ncbi:MAG: NADH-quinone oxidoreductase subunit B family protein [Vulcanimicrobiaceae bacterium]
MAASDRRGARETLDAVPRPRIVVAIGDCAVGEGPWSGAPSAGPGARIELQATITVRGCPPTPEEIRAAPKSLPLSS